MGTICTLYFVISLCLEAFLSTLNEQLNWAAFCPLYVEHITYFILNGELKLNAFRPSQVCIQNCRMHRIRSDEVILKAFVLLCRTVLLILSEEQ